MEPVNIRISGSVRGSLPHVPVSTTNLPPLDSEFTGRTTDLALLATALRDAPVTVVSGLAGVGKTTLALKAAGEFKGKVLFIDLEGYTNRVEPEAAVPQLLAELGVPQERIPAERSARESLYRARLDEEPQPVLVLLDNVSSAAQVRGLVPGSTRHRVLVTSRHTLAELNARLIELDVLTVEEAIALVGAALTTRRPNDPRTPNPALVELAGRLPLALSIIAAVLADDTTLSVDELVELLYPAADRLDELVMPDGHVGVRRAFDLSYARLTCDEQRLFRLLSVASAAEVALEHACALFGGEPKVVRKLMNSLRRAHLLEHGRSPGRFRLHDLLGLYSAECAAPDELGLARGRLVDHLTEVSEQASDKLSPTTRQKEELTRFTTLHEAVEWLDLEWPLLMHLLEQIAGEGQHDEVIRLMKNLVLFVQLRPSKHEWPTVHELGLASARALGDRRVEAALTFWWGNKRLSEGDLEGASRHYDTAIATYFEIGDADGLFAMVSTTAELLWHEEQLDLAEALLHSVLNIYIGIEEVDHAASAFYYLGCIAREKGALEQARDYQLLALRICEKTGDQHGKALVLKELGIFLFGEEREATALHVLTEAKKSVQLTGDSSLHAVITYMKGRAHAVLGQNAEAARCYREAVELYTEAGEDDEAGNVEELIASLAQAQLK